MNRPKFDWQQKTKNTWCVVNRVPIGRIFHSKEDGWCAERIGASHVYNLPSKAAASEWLENAFMGWLSGIMCE